MIGVVYDLKLDVFHVFRGEMGGEKMWTTIGNAILILRWQVNCG